MGRPPQQRPQGHSPYRLFPSQQRGLIILALQPYVPSNGRKTPKDRVNLWMSCSVFLPRKRMWNAKYVSAFTFPVLSSSRWITTGSSLCAYTCTSPFNVCSMLTSLMYGSSDVTPRFSDIYNNVARQNQNPCEFMFQFVSLLSTFRRNILGKILNQNRLGLFFVSDRLHWKYSTEKREPFPRNKPHFSFGIPAQENTMTIAQEDKDQEQMNDLALKW